MTFNNQLIDRVIRRQNKTEASFLAGRYMNEMTKLRWRCRYKQDKTRQSFFSLSS